MMRARTNALRPADFICNTTDTSLRSDSPRDWLLVEPLHARYRRRVRGRSASERSVKRRLISVTIGEGLPAGALRGSDLTRKQRSVGMNLRNATVLPLTGCCASSPMGREVVLAVAKAAFDLVGPSEPPTLAKEQVTPVNADEHAGVSVFGYETDCTPAARDAAIWSFPRVSIQLGTHI
jgi:hypothetical protein